MAWVMNFLKEKKLRFKTDDCGCFAGKKTNSEVLEEMTEDDILQDVKDIKKKIDELLEISRNHSEHSGSHTERTALALKVLTSLVQEIKKTVDILYDVNIPKTEEYQLDANKATKEFLEKHTLVLEGGDEVPVIETSGLAKPVPVESVRAQDFPLPEST